MAEVYSKFFQPRTWNRVVPKEVINGYIFPLSPYHSTYDSATGCIESLALARLPFGPAFRDERHPET
jgi:hypothetical protein